MTTHTTTTYMKTDEQLNDMTLVIVHKYYIIVDYYIVRYNMLYYCEVKTRKKCNLKVLQCLSQRLKSSVLFLLKSLYSKIVHEG